MADTAETALTLIKQEAPDYHDSCDTKFNTQRNGDYNEPTEIKAETQCIKTEDCAELPFECLKHQVQGANGEPTHIKCESDIKQEDGDCHYEIDPHSSMKMDVDFQQSENFSAMKQEIKQECDDALLDNQWITHHHYSTSSGISSESSNIEENHERMFNLTTTIVKLSMAQYHFLDLFSIIESL